MATYELYYFTEYWITVMKGTLESCKEYARQFMTWNSSTYSGLLVRNAENFEEYYFTENLDLITPEDYVKSLPSRKSVTMIADDMELA